jgi:hypothetical protein
MALSAAAYPDDEGCFFKILTNCPLQYFVIMKNDNASLIKPPRAMIAQSV